MSVAQLKELQFVSPRSLAEAFEAMARARRDGLKAQPIAGCTDWMVERHAAPISQSPEATVVIDVTRLPELAGIGERAGVVSIGAAQTFLAIARSGLLGDRCPLLVQMAREVGAAQIQARGTLGGNLVSGSPAADGVTALFALDAKVWMASERGERAVAIRSFYTGYRASVLADDELVVRFEFKAPAAGSHQLWRKIGTRNAQAISKAAIALVCELGPAGVVQRVGFGAGAVAPTVRPLSAAAALVLGKRVADLDLDQLQRTIDSEIEPIDDLRSTARYRRHLVCTLIRRFFERLGAR